MAYDQFVRLRVLLMALAGCGRLGFEATGDASLGSIGHDEDGDGIGDASDVCPHLPGTQADSDGDRVGDDCDPNPTEPRDTVAVFATMQPGDNPLVDFVSDGTLMQRDDSLELSGVPDPDGYMTTSLGLMMPMLNAQIAVGFDIIARFDGQPQNQFAIGVLTTPPYYYVELNETPSLGSRAQIVMYDGGFFGMDAQPLAGQIHTGAVFLQGTYVVGGGVRLDGGWPGESYVSRVMTQQYQGGDHVRININNLLVEIRYVCVITSS